MKKRDVHRPAVNGRIGEDLTVYYITKKGYNILCRNYRIRGAEIDIIAEDEINTSAVFYEVERQARNISLKTLQRKAEIFLKTTGAFQDYQIAYQGVSMEDM